MATKKQNKKTTSKPKTQVADRGVIDNIWGIILIAIGIFLFVAVKFNAAGELGGIIGEFLRGTFGLIGIILPFYMVLFGFLLLADKTVHISGYSAFLGFMILLMMCLINSGRFIDTDKIAFAFSDFYTKGVSLEGGGFFGMSIGMVLAKYFGKVGLYSISAAVIFVSLLLIINTPISRAVEAFKEKLDDRAARKEADRIEREKIFAEESVRNIKFKEREIRKREKEIERQLKEQKKERAQASLFTPEDTETPVVAPRLFQELPEKNTSSNAETVISLMNDDSIFEKKDNEAAPKPEYVSQTSFGIDEPRQTKAGFGLDGGDDVQAQEIFEITRPAADKEAEEEKHSDFGKISKKEASEAVLDKTDFNQTKKSKKYRRPPVELLKKADAANDGGARSGKFQSRAILLEDTMRSFGVGAKVTQVTQGPAVTRYEIQPDPGVRVNKIVGLSNDIALKLRAKSLRIEAPIPGKDAVGIEIENENIKMVTLREIVEGKEFKDAKSKITFAVGRDIAGKAIVANLKEMPHLLIAGSTGSGKSVCINSIIMSLIYKADPDEVKLVLIDPKVVELGNYNGIPHLLIPVVTEASKAAAALNWAVAEMTDRYKKFAEANVRNLASYNEHMISDGKKEETLPQIVIIIDELADLMMAAPKQVEESICRLAQLARAAGMHLIVATQRPSVDIITGLIKANIPSRIAFAVSSQYDSRTILDVGGAEHLVGKGDMLFNPLGSGSPIRVQGCFVSDGEVMSVIDFVKAQIEEVEYNGEVMNTIDKGNGAQAQENSDDDDDEFMNDAIECVVNAGQASVSMLQRRFRVGYNRAARMIDVMEARGIVGPQDGSRPRQVLISKEDFASYSEGEADE